MLNVIDTPGFGDTRGIAWDLALVNQIRYLFSAKDERSVLFIDAVCFIVKASDARLTVSQRYIFNSIMSLFGKDIESNLCTMITFADGGSPTVLDSLKEFNLPFKLTFNFNNLALFADNRDLKRNMSAAFFWEMSCNSFNDFFKHIEKLITRSLSLTKDVLEEREQLKTVVSHILPQINAGLSKLSELHDHLDILIKFQNEIKDNKNFTYTVQQTKQKMIPLSGGHHVTNCLQCNISCHENCQIADDDKKQSCWAMDTSGNCRICSGKCIWSVHKNTPYIFRYVTETITETYAEMKRRYENASGQKLTHEKYIEDLSNEVEDLFEGIKTMVNKMNRCKKRLQEIAMRPDPLSAVDYIELMIKSEEMEKHPGYLKRIEMLQNIKKSALVDQEVANLSKSIQITRENVKSATGKAHYQIKSKSVNNISDEKRSFHDVTGLF